MIYPSKTLNLLLLSLCICLACSCDTKLRQEHKKLKKQHKALQKHIKEKELSHQQKITAKDKKIQQWGEAYKELEKSHNQVVSEKNSLKKHLNKANKNKELLKETVEELGEDLSTQKFANKLLWEAQDQYLTVWLTLALLLIGGGIVIYVYFSKNRNLYATVKQNGIIIEDWEQHNGQVEAQLVGVQSKIQQKHQELDLAESKYQNLMKDYEQSFIITKNWEDKYNRIQKRIEAADKMLLEQVSIIEDLQRNRQQEQEQLTQTKAEIDQLEKVDYQNQLTNQSLQQKLETIQKELAKGKSIIESLKHNQQEQKHQLNIAESKLKKLAENHKQTITINTNLDKKRNQLQEEISNKQSMIEDLKNQLQQKKKKIAQAESEIIELKEKNLKSQFTIKDLEHTNKQLKKDLDQTISKIKSTYQVTEPPLPKTSPKDKSYLEIELEKADKEGWKEFISFQNVAYIELDSKDNSTVFIYTIEDIRYKSTGSLKSWLEELKMWNGVFFRVEAQYIVNKEAVIIGDGNSSPILRKDGKNYLYVKIKNQHYKLEISRTYLKEVRTIFGIKSNRRSVK